MNSMHSLRIPLRFLALLFVALLQQSTLAAAADWPQWRGAQRDGISTETGLIKEWPTNGPPVVWLAHGLGRGYSSVAVAGAQIFTMGDGPESSFVHALSAATGKMEWSTKVGKPGGDYPGTRCTPTVDGELVFALGQFGDLVCLKAKDGTLLWRKNLEKDLGGKMMSGWGYSESVLVDGDQVVCTPGGTNGTLAAFNKKTGEVLWRSKEFIDRAAYSSIIIAEISGVRQYIQLTDASVAGLAPEDGRLLWKA